MTQARVLITGAGSGLGRALAKRYARAGYAVAVADIHLGRAEETVAELGGDPHLALPVDVGNDTSVTQLRDALNARWNSLDVLINNAGVASGGSLIDSTMDEWQWMLNINLLGVVRGCKTFLPDMLGRGRGQIINIASFAGLAAAPQIMTYGVAKAGVVTLSEQLRAEVHARGIVVSVVCPSFFPTNLCENFRGDERMKQTATRLMEKAKVSADDVADVIFEQARKGAPLILPTGDEAWRWRLKRFLPNFYFKQLLKLTRARGEATRG